MAKRSHLRSIEILLEESAIWLCSRLEFSCDENESPKLGHSNSLCFNKTFTSSVTTSSPVFNPREILPPREQLLSESQNCELVSPS